MIAQLKENLRRAPRNRYSDIKEFVHTGRAVSTIAFLIVMAIAALIVMVMVMSFMPILGLVYLAVGLVVWIRTITRPLKVEDDT